MTTLDIDFVRAQFPAFAEPSLSGFAHFENAGGSYACGPVIEQLNRYYRETKAATRIPVRTIACRGGPDGQRA